MANETNGTETTEETTPEIVHVIDPESLVIKSILPGILVNLTCHMRGGRETKREDIKVRKGKGGKKTETWKAVRVIYDENELKRADKERAKVHRDVKKLGCETAVGLIVAAHRKQELAQTLSACHNRVKAFNKTAQTMDLVFRYGLYSVEGNNSGTIAAVTEQLGDILERVNSAVQSDEQAILENARANQLGDFKTAKEVMEAPREQRIAIIAKIRADLARKAIAEAKSFSTLLPEEAGLAVTDMVASIRKSATAWVKASKESDEEYEAALNTVDSDMISDMQAALVQAAALADQSAEAETEAIADQGDLFDGEVEEEIASDDDDMVGAI